MTYRCSSAESHAPEMRACGLPARTYNGVILLDRAGNPQGHNAGLEWFVNKYSGHEWEAMFALGAQAWRLNRSWKIPKSQ